jgi:Zn-dependent protease
MFNSSYKIATVWGIPIKLHSSLLLLMAIYAITGGVRNIMPIILLEIGLFTSIALHELGHSFVALRKGCRVREITLMFMGGAAQMEEIPKRPIDEIQMAIAGPLVSISLGLIGIFSARLLSANGMGRTADYFGYLGFINLLLAGFNLLPAFPMDGGRVFRAALTKKKGRLKATFIASRLGRILAALFGMYGFYGLLHGRPFAVLTIAVAFFIYTAAANEYKMVQMQEAYDNQTGAQQGSSPWGNFSQGIENQWRGKNNDDQVSVSPPPYSDDPDSKKDIRQDDNRDRLRRL